jgi:hypothetical protein
MEPTGWDWSNSPEWDGTYVPREDGWYAVWLSYGDTEYDMSIEACHFLDSKPNGVWRCCSPTPARSQTIRRPDPGLMLTIPTGDAA